MARIQFLEHFERAKKAVKLINELLVLEGQIMGWEKVGTRLK